MQNTMPNKWEPFCFFAVLPATILHVLEVGSLLQGSGDPSTKLETPVLLCVPTIWHNQEGLTETTGGQGYNNFDQSYLAVSGMVCVVVLNEYKKPNSLTWKEMAVDKPSG